MTHSLCVDLSRAARRHSRHRHLLTKAHQEVLVEWLSNIETRQVIKYWQEATTIFTIYLENYSTLPNNEDKYSVCRTNAYTYL